MKEFRHTVIYHTDCALPLYDEVDVLVCGGGPAGIAAASMAARQGRSVLLVERLGFLGGAAVAGGSGTVCGTFLCSDTPEADGPRQTVFGFTEEFLQAMRARGGVTPPQLYGKTYLITHDPQVYKEVAEELVLGAGAGILYHTNIFGVIKEGDIFYGVVIDTKSGLAQIRAKVLIDATGDADLVYRAGGGYTMGDNGTIQNPTAMFRLGGVDTARFSDYWGPDTISPDCVTELLHEANRQGWHLPRAKVWVFPTPRPGELLMNTTLLTGRDGRALNVCNPEDHTEAEIVGRRQVQEYARFFREHIPGCEHSFINDCSPEVGVRQTRSIRGIARLTNDDVAHARKRSDGICRCPWPIELHAGETPYLFWLINDYYEVPYGSLVPETGEHLLVAGRNLCAEHQALASCRVTAQCFEYGHAAALAADLSIRRDLPLRELSGAEIRARMNENGALSGAFSHARIPNQLCFLPSYGTIKGKKGGAAHDQPGLC